MYNKYCYFQVITDYLEKLLNLFGYFFGGFIKYYFHYLILQTVIALTDLAHVGAMSSSQLHIMASFCSWLYKSKMNRSGEKILTSN